MRPRVRVKIYKAKDGWRWRMRRKGRIIAESGEAYTRKASLKRSLTNLIETKKHQFQFIETEGS